MNSTQQDPRGKSTLAPDDGNGFSFDAIAQLRSEVHRHISKQLNAISQLAEADCDLDAALMASAERDVDTWASAVTAAGRLAGLLGGSAVISPAPRRSTRTDLPVDPPLPDFMQSLPTHFRRKKR